MLDFKKIPWPVYLRLILGIAGIGGGLHNLIDPIGFIERMKGFAVTTPFIWYGDLLNNIFVPNATLVVYSLAAITIFGGILLIFGLFINLGCLLGIPVCLHFIFSAPLQAIINVPLMIALLIVLFSKRSRRYSLDEKIFKKFQKS